MTISEEDKICPILKASQDIVMGMKSLVYVGKFGQCIREQCLWYGNGCPAYPTQLEIDIYKQDKEFYKELEEGHTKSD